MDLRQALSKVPSTRRHQVLSLVGPTEGTCSPGCAVSLNWLFNPIAPAEHLITVPVSITSGPGDSGATFNLAMQGAGFHPGQSLRPALSAAGATDAQQPLGWRNTPAIPLNPLLAVSESAVHLGATELQGVLRRLVVLRPAGGAAVEFTWHVGEFGGGGALEGQLRVEPESGTLLPGEAAVCQLVYEAGVEAQWLEGEVAVAARALEAADVEQLLAGAGADLNRYVD